MKKLLPVIALLIFGCSEQQTKPQSHLEPVYSKQYRDHAMTAIVSLSETNLPSSGKIILMLEIHTPAGTEPTFPNIGNKIDPFSLGEGYTEPVQTLPNGKQMYRRVWQLLPSLPGKTVLQPLELSAGTDSITTEPIPIEITSLIPEGTDSLEIRDIAAPIELLPSQEKKRRSIYTVVGSLFILSLIPFIIYLLRKPKTVAVTLPHEAAFQALENLPENTVERIHELNRIFRTYHEARFGLPMIGKTAVELAVVLEDTAIISFLERCDDIRFSNKVPEGFAEEAEQFVRAYVEKTMEVPE
ncbi:hypothetical protein [Pontiella agarivorans]|uniref:Uncharacterized protein n=1 Tax=Pontiella agarivorans TaxID=3038953 RepID=A0ABU5MUZ8_9BACT|nr:hypothetical protein [Pontiella agarivorans]MDZ8118041.1 hypothetical protein [Pontiella agarivorans]